MQRKQTNRRLRRWQASIKGSFDHLQGLFPKEDGAVGLKGSLGADRGLCKTLSSLILGLYALSDNLGL